MEVAECHKAFYRFHGYMDIRLLGKVVLWLNGNMAALHKVVPCTSKRVYFVCFVNSFLYLRIYLSQYIRRCLHHNTEAPSQFFAQSLLWLPQNRHGLGHLLSLSSSWNHFCSHSSLSFNSGVEASFFECDSSICKKNCHRKRPRLL